MAVVSDVEIRLRADIARLRQDLQDARREVTGALGSMSAAAEAFKGVLGGIAAGLSVGAFAAFIKQSIDAADALNDMSVRTKVAIEDLAGLAYAAKLGDTSLEGVASSITKLGQNIGKDGAKFRELGITTTEPLEAFKQLADVFKNIQDPQQRAAFGAEALGKSWQEAAVLLEGGSEGIGALIARGKELSGITEQVAADAGAFNDKLDELSFAAQGAGTRIAAGLLPTLIKMADSFSANSVNGKTMDNTITALAATLKGLYSVGIGVSALFVGLGKSIGGTAAVAVAALSGDFKGALQIYKEMAADVYTGLGDAAIQIGKLWVDTGATVVKTAADAAKAAGDTAAKVAAFLGAGDDAREASADKQGKIAAEAEKWAAKTIEDAQKHIAVLKAELDATVPLTAEQKKTIEVMVEMEKRRANLSDEQRKNITSTRAEVELLERLTAARIADKKALQDAEDAAKRDTDAAWDKVRSLQEQVKTYGMTEEAVLRLQAVEYQRQLGAAENSETEQQRLAMLLGATEEQIKLQTKLSKMKADTAFWDGLENTAHQTFISIANGGKDTAQRLRDTFKNTFFDWLYQQTIKKWIINIGTETTTGSTASSIASLFGGGASGGGSGAGGILGTASNWLSIGKTIYSGFTGGLVSSLGSSISSMGATLGSEAVAAFGAGIQGGALGAGTASAASGYAGTTAAGFGASAASAIPIIGWIIAGMQAADSFRKQGFTANNGTINNPILQAAALPTNFAEKTMKAIGLNDAISNILSGAAINTKLFGRADPRVEAQGIRGTVSAAGFDADSYAKIIEKGGIFRSSKRYEKSADLDAATDKAWDETIGNMITSVKGFGSAMGLETKAIDSYTKSFDLKLTGKAGEDNAAVAKLFGDVGNELSLRLVPGLAAFAKEGETLSATIQRLAIDYMGVDEILSATGQTIKLVGVAGIQAREDLIAAAGGLEQLSSGVGYFQQNFFSEAEKLAPVQKQVAEAMAALGQSAVKTNDQFKAAVLGIDLGTKAGAELYVQMLALAPAFKAVADASAEAEATAKAQADAAIAAAKAIADEQIAAAKAIADAQIAQAKAVADALAETNKGYDDQIEALLAARAGAAAVRALEIRDMDATTVQRYDYLKALQAEDAALAAAAQAAKDAAAAQAQQLADNQNMLRAAISTALSGLSESIANRKNELKTALDRVMNMLAAGVDSWAARISDLKSLKDLLRGAKVGATEGAGSRAAAQAQLEAALATATASGVLPSADDLRDAISAVSRDSSDQFASLIEYQRDQARAQRSIAGLAGLTDEQLTTAERTLAVLQGQKASAEAAYAIQIASLDALAAQARRSAEIALGTYQATLDGNAAVATLAAAIAALRMGATTGNPTGTGLDMNGLYQSVLGRAPDAAGAAFWAKFFGDSIDANDYAEFVKGAQAELAMRGNDWSANPAYAPAPAPTPSSTAAIDTLNTQMAGMQTAMNRTAAATTQLAEQFSRVSGNGNALAIES